MKKLLLGFLLIGTLMNSCKKEDDSTEVSVDINTQNQLDTQAITEYLNAHYVDSRGKVTAFSSTDASDDNYKKLSELTPVTLPSGVIYIKFPDAQPEPGKVIQGNDILHLMVVADAYIAKTTDGKTTFQNKSTFKNTIMGAGIPEVDPVYFYANEDLLKKSGKTREYFEIEGFREGLMQFLAFDKNPADPYRLQGLIIVPSKAAFARDDNYFNAKDRSFIFNFQVYKTETRK